jgi:hypothetical protein
MSQTLFLEAFGQLSRDTSLPGIVSEDEDLYSVFNARAELMSWATTATQRRRVELWGMEEAELTVGTDASRIGWVQVGLGEVVEPGTLELPTPTRGYTSLPVVRRSAVEPPMALPALVQCFDDALRRFGAVELAGLQVTAINLEPSTRSCLGDFVGVLNWFNTTQKARADALITISHELLGGHTEAELVASLQRWNTGSFEFGPVVAVPEQHWIKAPFEAPLRFTSPVISPACSGLGLSVTLPEWTASAVGWVLGKVIDEARAGAPDVPNFAVRVTRVR